MRYEETHPWIDFSAKDLRKLGERVWMLIGEARSKCQHLAGTPLRPDIARHLFEVSLVKGALASTAIEGNTLSQEQAEAIFRDEFKAPPSRAYQERELRNVLEALGDIDRRVMAGEPLPLSVDLIGSFNFRVLDGTDHEDWVVPGEIRTKGVGVGPYRGAPAEDCPYLIGRLVEWLDGPSFRSDDPEIAFALDVIRAIYAHLYIAWIHPFGDGNGRTARLVEFAILARCGQVPLPAAHLLSNHYNLTRDQYYRELPRASAARDTSGFIAYAVQGLVDGIREQIDLVRDQQVHVTWINFVHESMRSHPANSTRERRIELVLAMGAARQYSRSELEGLTPSLAAKYAKAGDRTIARDLNALIEAGLVARVGKRYQAAVARIAAFLPPMAPGTSHP